MTEPKYGPWIAHNAIAAALLALATPAHAALIDTIEVNLDEGDAGVCMTYEGFRPCDGIDTYGAKFDMPPVLFPPASCHTAYDRWVPVKRATWTCASGTTVHFVPSPLTIASAVPANGCWCIPPVGYVGSVPPSYRPPRYGTLPPVTDWPITYPPGTPVPPAPSPVPLPASGLMLLAGLVGLIWRAK